MRVQGGACVERRGGERGSKGEERWEVNGKERRGGRGVVCFLHVLSVWTLHQMKVVI